MSGDWDRAKALLSGSERTFAACRGEQVYDSTRRGVAPLLELLDRGVSLAGFSVADRVVGRAAAFLYLRLGAERVYARVMSRPAQQVFADAGVACACEEWVPLIRNRTDTDLCPMEKAVLDIRDKDEAEQAIRRRLKELSE